MCHPADSLSARSDIVSPGRRPLCPVRHCLTRQTASLAGQTLSHLADSLSGRADNVWPGRQCLAWHTASLAGQTHPAGRPSDLAAHNLSDPAKTRQIVRCLRMLTHARSYLNPSTPQPCRGSPRDRSTRSIGDPLGLDRLDRFDRSGIP